ncbi:hypothetical protein NC652_005606 [Populus alba x Populus x berolinensis]|nr:hypothetical protein NC652_005606 [Populus alba x Populus x berolinensis]
MIAMAMKSYQSHAELLVKEYLLADPLIPYTSIIGGICACKMVYDLTNLFSAVYFKSYSSLTKSQRIEWNNRAISTFHAVFIATMALYFVFCSDLFSDQFPGGLVTFQSSALSTFALGVSVGYFISDLGMIIWVYPSLGGMEYVIHHFLSMISVAYSMLTGEGQLYAYMVLISETTTPGVNLRWYLDIAGMKRSKAYLVNGVVIFFAWFDTLVYLLVLPCLPAPISGQTNARLWTTLGTSSASSAICHELDVVLEDFQGDEKDISEAALNNISNWSCTYKQAMYTSTHATDRVCLFCAFSPPLSMSTSTIGSLVKKERVFFLFTDGCRSNSRGEIGYRSTLTSRRIEGLARHLLPLILDHLLIPPETSVSSESRVKLASASTGQDVIFGGARAIFRQIEKRVLKSGVRRGNLLFQTVKVATCSGIVMHHWSIN